MTGRPSGPEDRFTAWLTGVRTSTPHRMGLAFAGVVLGLAGGTVSWFALVLGGALVALPARSVGRGIAAGIGLGLLELAVFVGLLVTNGTFGPAVPSLTGQVGAVTIAVGMAAPVLGSLVRGLV